MKPFTALLVLLVTFSASADPLPLVPRPSEQPLLRPKHRRAKGKIITGSIFMAAALTLLVASMGFAIAQSPDVNRDGGDGAVTFVAGHAGMGATAAGLAIGIPILAVGLDEQKHAF